MLSATPNLSISPFLAFLGASFQTHADGELALTIQLAPHHLNLFGSAHGGLIQSLNDAAMAQAARTLHQGQKAVLTLQMQTYFLHAESQLDAELRVHAKVIHHTLTMAVCEAECYSQQQLLAKSTGQFKFARLR